MLPSKQRNPSSGSGLKRAASTSLDLVVAPGKGKTSSIEGLEVPEAPAPVDDVKEKDLEEEAQEERAATEAHLSEMMHALGTRAQLRASTAAANKKMGNGKGGKGKGKGKKGKGKKGKGKKGKGGDKSNVSDTQSADAPAAKHNGKAKAGTPAKAEAKANAKTQACIKKPAAGPAAAAAAAAEEMRRKAQQAKNAATAPQLQAYLKKHAGQIPTVAVIKKLLPGGCTKCRWGASGCTLSCWTYAYGPK